MGNARRLSALVVAGLIVAGVAGSASATPPTWTIEPSANRGTGDNSIIDVSCTSPSACMAVGQFKDPSQTVTKALAIRWNGHNWRLTPVRTRSSSTFFHVSCATATFCIAVGSGTTSGGSPALAEKWDGSTWTVLRNPAGPKPGFWRAVACASPTMCALTGARFDESGEHPVLAQWDGAQLATVPSPDAGGLLTDVSCPTTTKCVAVGPGGALPDSLLVETYDGEGWTAADVPIPSSIAELDSVSCGTATSCMAIGQYYDWDAGQWLTLVERWDGETWTHDPDPVAKGSFIVDLSCAAATECVAVGGKPGTGKYGANLAMTWDGTTWTATSPPNAGHFTNALWAVSCPATTTCQALGYYMHDRKQQTVAVGGT